MNKSQRIKLCKKYHVGQIVCGKVIRIEPYGAFIKLDSGLIGLAHIVDLSVARIKSPFDRVKIGQNISTMIKYINEHEGYINLSYKACLGSWEDNIKNFTQGTITRGIIKETDKNNSGIFIELTPNLIGMSEYESGHNYGDKVDVYIKKIDPIKKKVKLVIV